MYEQPGSSETAAAVTVELIANSVEDPANQLVA
jgi:hypothetical protein